MFKRGTIAAMLVLAAAAATAKNNEFAPYGFIDEMPYAMGQCFNNIIEIDGVAADFELEATFDTVSAIGKQRTYSGDRCAVFLFNDAVVGVMEGYMGTPEKAEWLIKDDGVHLYGPNGTYSAAMEYALSTREHKKVMYLHDIEGSFDDSVNLEVAMTVRHKGYNTVLPQDGFVASGGADFFLAGVKRAVENQYEYGVHSWGADDGEAMDFPRDHPVHQEYLEFYRELGINETFYWFTLESAPASDIHLMSRDEMDGFNLINASFEAAIK